MIDFLTSLSLTFALTMRWKPITADLKVTTSSDPKYFSLGLDFAALNVAPKDALIFLETYQKMLARLVKLPMPTVAAVNGHCTAGGGFFALCHDYTIASSEKGLFFMNEIDLGLGFAEGMAKVLTYVKTARGIELGIF